MLMQEYYERSTHLIAGDREFHVLFHQILWFMLYIPWVAAFDVERLVFKLREIYAWVELLILLASEFFSHLCTRMIPAAFTRLRVSSCIAQPDCSCDLVSPLNIYTNNCHSNNIISCWVNPKQLESKQTNTEEELVCYAPCFLKLIDRLHGCSRLWLSAGVFFFVSCMKLHVGAQHFITEIFTLR